MFDKYSNRRLSFDKMILPFLSMAVFLIYLSGCSTTHNYKALSFFFDGVPNPDKETTIQSGDSLSRTDSMAIAQNLVLNAPPQMQFHPPYQDKECGTCHDQSNMGKFVESQPDLCYECHEDFSKKYKVLHGPVAGGQCTMCHNPHSSVNENLLTRTNQSLCLYCHESKQVMEAEQHLDIKDVNCTECHNPHGGEDRNVLR